VPVFSDAGYPATPWWGSHVWEVDTDLEKRRNRDRWEVVGYRGDPDGQPRISLYQAGGTPTNAVEATCNMNQIRKQGAIDQILSYSNGYVTFLARCRVRIDAMLLTDSGARRWSRFVLWLPASNSFGFQGTVEDQRTISGTVNFGGVGTMRQSLSTGSIDVMPGDQTRISCISTTDNGSVVPNDAYLSVSLVS
jgi:hypothetical protein